MKEGSLLSVQNTSDQEEDSILLLDGAPPDLTVPFHITLFFSLMFPLAVGSMLLPFTLFVIVVFNEDLLDIEDKKRVLITTWIGHTSLIILVMAVFMQRLKKQPVRARSPLFMMVSATAGYLLVSWLCFSFFFQDLAESSCSFIHFIFNISYPAFILPYFFRAYRLWYVFNLNREAFSGDNDFGKESYKGTQKYLFRRFCLAMVPFAVLSIVEAFTHWNVFPVCPLDTHWLYGVFWVCLHGLEALAFIVSIFLLRRVWDMYSIRSELHIASYITLVFAVILALFQWKTIGRHATAEFALLTMTRVLAFFTLSVLWPLYRTFFKATVTQDWTRMEALGSLDQILGDPICFPYFREFMVQELNAELLKFWVEVDLHRELQQDQLLENAVRIFDTYIKERRVALTEGVLRGLVGVYRECVATGRFSTHLFDGAQAEVFRTMETVSYPRFLESELCSRLVHEIQQQADVMGRLVSSNVI